jgi:hypothetical protein
MAHPELSLQSVSSTDESLVELNPNQTEVAKKEIGELWMVLRAMNDHIEKGTFTVSIRDSHCGCLEASASRFCKAVGHDGDLEAKRREDSSYVVSPHQWVPSQEGPD